MGSRLHHDINKKTKKAHALEIFNANKHKTRDEIFEIFVKELDTTRGTARTYLSLSIKEMAKDNKTPRNILYRNRQINKKNLKREKAFEIFEKNKTSIRKDIIQMFVEDLGMSLSSAATHCSICVHKYLEKNPTTAHSSIIRKSGE